jgi:nucleoside-diphosphate-sugar epimerase
VKAAVVSGATGLVGSLMVAELLLRGTRCLALTRSAQAAEAVQAAVYSALRGHGASRQEAERLVASSALVPLTVDWSDIDGLWTRVLANLDGVPLSAVFHCAADLSYGRKNLPDSYRQNVLCSTALYQAAHRERVALESTFRFHYVSTAYSIGMTEALVTEQLHHGTEELPTVYHLTKNAAEKNLFLSAQGPEALPLTILRPSGIVGHSESGWYGSHAAGMAQVCELMATMEKVGLTDVTLNVRMDTSLSLVPVDYVVRWALQVHEASVHEAPQVDIVHLAPVQWQTSQEVMDATGRAFSAHLRGGLPREPFDRKLDEAAGMAKLYWNHTWRFERRRLGELVGVDPAVDPFDIFDVMAKTGAWWREHRVLRRQPDQRRARQAGGMAMP